MHGNRYMTVIKFHIVIMICNKQDMLYTSFCVPKSNFIDAIFAPPPKCFLCVPFCNKIRIKRARTGRLILSKGIDV